MLKTKDAYFAAAALLLVLTVGSAAVAYKKIVGPSQDFYNAIDVGLSKGELIAQAGKPNAKVTAGEIIPRWGNAPERKADRETWIYFVYPESQHRFVVSFDDEKIVSIEHGQN